MPRLLVLAAGLLLAATTAAPAHAVAGFGLRAGFLDREEADGRPHSAGAFVRLHSGALGVEVGADRWTFERADGAEVTSTPITFGLLAYPVPFAYALAGGGLYDASITQPTLGLDRDASELGWVLGAGLELPIVPALRFTGDVRWGFIDRDRERLALLGLDDRDWLVFHVGAMLALPPAP
jgi:hypothetical protein